MSPWLLYAIKTCGWGCIIPGKATWTTSSIHPAFPSIHIAHSSAPLASHLPCFQEKVNSRSSSFFSMEDPSTLPSARPFLPPNRFHPVLFLWKKRGSTRLSSWIIHNQFHREPDGQKTTEWRAGGISLPLSRALYSFRLWAFLIISTFRLSNKRLHVLFIYLCESSLWSSAFNLLSPQLFFTLFVYRFKVLARLQ